MPNPFSNDLRERIINSFKKDVSIKEIVETFDIKKSTVYQWIKRYKSTGDFKSYPQNGGRRSSLSSEQFEQINEQILLQPDITLLELKEKLDLAVCISALCRIIKNKLKFNLKKKRYTPANKIEKM